MVAPAANQDCKHLWEHLKVIWPQLRVLQARKFDGQSVCDVLCKKFNDLLVDPRTNDLIVDVEELQER